MATDSEAYAGVGDGSEVSSGLERAGSVIETIFGVGRVLILERKVDCYRLYVWIQLSDDRIVLLS